MQAPLTAEHDGPAADEKETPKMGLMEALFRDPARFAEIARTSDGPEIAKMLVATIVVAGACFGVTLGLFRGGVQVAYCAVKVPAVLLATLVIAVPAFLAIGKALRIGASARSVVLLSLGASARFSLVVAGLAPVLWILEGWVGYHRMVVGTFVACAIGGVMAGGLLFRGLAASGAKVSRSALELGAVAFVLVYGLVGAQTSWLLRPFIVRPKTEHVPFVRAVESDLFDAIGQSAKSALGIYDRERAREGRACDGASCD